jgi:E3 ubiquitin-protein ligase DOA10
MLVDTDYVQLLTTMRTQWYRFALGDHSSDRMVCILVGYGVLVTIGSWYLARSRNAYGRTVGRAVQQAIRQQGAILKVTFFIGIELMLFPLVCGILLDLSTLPLFPESTVISRINYWRANPGIWTFLHWLLGTIFMFHFAVFVTLCRDVVRPGVMWFIRNPNDPQFHPIKEILERPVMFQLRKIGISALLYGGLIVFGIGSVVFSISHFGGSILPLRLSMQ